MGVDRAEMNRRIFDALRPGGVFLVNPMDEGGENVFHDSIRGRTDRFLMRFEKPGFGE